MTRATKVIFVIIILVASVISLISLVRVLLGSEEFEINKILNKDNKIIESVKIVQFSELDKSLQEDITFCSYVGSGSTDIRSFDCKKSYFAVLKINNKVLTKINSADLIKWDDHMTSDYLLNGPDGSNLKNACLWSYGKYKNQWVVTGEQEIPITDKFDGFDIYKCERVGDIDNIVIGAFLSEPKKISIVSQGSGSEMDTISVN